jgi:hypothetical protein
VPQYWAKSKLDVSSEKASDFAQVFSNKSSATSLQQQVFSNKSSATSLQQQVFSKSSVGRPFANRMSLTRAPISTVDTANLADLAQPVADL